MTYNKKLRILNLEPKGYSAQATKILERLGIVDNGPLDRTALLNSTRDYDVLIVRLGHKIDAEVMAAAPNLKTIVTSTTGLDHIDMEEARQRGIEVLSLRGERGFLNSVYATAEHTWALLLALIRKLPHAHQHVLSGSWDRDLFRGYELNGRTLGIVGIGRIGIKVARYGIAFGMRVLGCDIKEPAILPEGVELGSLESVLAESDIVSVHVDYNSENYGMIGQKLIASMKKGAFFINTSRGGLVDEKALLDGLVDGDLGGAALDVLCDEYTERNGSAPLIDYAKDNMNLIITPHIGGCTFDSMEKTEIFMAKKLLRHYSQDV